MRIALFLVAAALFAAVEVDAEPAGRRRALLVGINDYGVANAAAGARDWSNLGGAVHDAGLLREMLVLLYGFEPRDIVTLTDHAATREAILQAIETHLLESAAAGDVLFFYFAGHGSQVPNSRSDEPDKLDESLVPADSMAGAADIRDKELRPLFNRMLDRGARLTVLLDHCHSGSAARGLPTGARPRGVARELRDVADARDYGPRPENRGALVLAAAQDYDNAWEVRDAEGQMHGAFSWAWMRAMRDASAGEAAIETFLRAQARLRGETPFQEPVISGNADARLNPFLGTRVDRINDRAVVAVGKVESDGTVVLRGGWANGLSVGSELRVVSDGERATRLTVTAIRGMGESEARIEAGDAPRFGTLVELVGWSAPPGRPLRVWAPRIAGSIDDVASLARAMHAAARKRGVRWIDDPLSVTPTHVLRRRADGWELLGPRNRVEQLAGDAKAIAAIARIPRGASLFVQLPAPAAMLDDLAIDDEGIDVASAADSDYVLVGRYAANSVEYAWLRPAVTSDDRRKSGLPLRTAWTTDGAATLRAALLRLRKIHAWHHLESPPDGRMPYRVALRRARGGDLVKHEPVIGNEIYHLVLRADAPLPPLVPQRHYYVFVIDSHGRSFLAFPQSGSVENRFPLQNPPSAEIPLGDAGAVEIQPPYGVDSYFLLSTDEPLPNPWILEWDGVRAPWRSLTPLEQLLTLTNCAHRSGARPITPATWSIEKIAFESVPPQK